MKYVECRGGEKGPPPPLVAERTFQNTKTGHLPRWLLGKVSKNIQTEENAKSFSFIIFNISKHW